MNALAFGARNAFVHVVAVRIHGFGRNSRLKLARCVMTQSAIVRWSSPRVILVATNCLEGQSLLLNSIYQARISHANVLLVHVIPHSHVKADYHGSAPQVLPGPTVRAIKARLDEMAKECQKAGVLCEPIILTGHAAEQISLIVKLRDVDRVIVGTRYVSGVARLVEPSVAEELIATLETPVCVIGRRTHPGDANDHSLGNVLLAASLQAGPSLVANFASALAELNGSRLTLVHVLDTNGMAEQERELVRMAARRKLALMIPSAARHSHQPVLLVREGDPATVILHEAGSLFRDVLVLGSSHSSITPRILGRGIVHRVIGESQCPVIIVRSTNPIASEEACTIGTSAAPTTGGCGLGDSSGER